MERMTYEIENGFMLKGNIQFWDAIDRLGAYESTGVTPEQVIKWRENQLTGTELEQICKSLEELKKYKSLEERAEKEYRANIG